jgi:hypothetical protein
MGLLNELLEYIRPSSWSPGDFSFVWMYLVILAVSYYALKLGRKRLDHYRTFSVSRVTAHNEQVRRIRELQQQRLLEEASNRPEPEETKQTEKPVEERGRPKADYETRSDRPQVRTGPIPSVGTQESSNERAVEAKESCP